MYVCTSMFTSDRVECWINSLLYETFLEDEQQANKSTLLSVVLLSNILIVSSFCLRQNCDIKLLLTSHVLEQLFWLLL